MLRFTVSVPFLIRDVEGAVPYVRVCTLVHSYVSS